MLGMIRYDTQSKPLTFEQDLAIQEAEVRRLERALMACRHPLAREPLEEQLEITQDYVTWLKEQIDND